MRPSTTRLSLRAVAGLIFVLAILGQAISSRMPCASRPVLLPLEFAADRAMVDAPLPIGSDARHGAAIAQKIDFAFIVNYWLVFVLVGFVFFRGPRTAWQLAGAALMLCASVAAVSDVFENRAILAALAGSGPFESPAAWATRKWTFVFLCFLLISCCVLWPLRRRRQPAGLLLIAGLLQLVAAVIGLSMWWRNDHQILPAMGLAGLGSFILALVCIWYPEDVVEPVEDGTP